MRRATPLRAIGCVIPLDVVGISCWYQMTLSPKRSVFANLEKSTEPISRRRISAGTIELESPMEKSVFAQARDLPPAKRHAAEILLGGALGEDELVLIRSSKGRILKPGLTGDALAEAYHQLSDWTAEMAKRAEGIPESEIDAAIDEAVDFVRHKRG